MEILLRFWEDKWYAGVVIKELFSRLYALELHKHAAVRMKLMTPSLDNSFRRRVRSGAEKSQFHSLLEIVQVINLVPCEDRYFCSLESERDYSVAFMRKLIDEKRFQEVDISTRWVKSVPSKVNITAWKIKTNALPMKFNLSRRGMDIDTLMCPVCKGGVETTSHLFFQCTQKEIYHPPTTPDPPTDLFLPSSVVATRWVKHVPIKVNIFAWRARLDRLPTRGNLISRGVLLESSYCLNCDLATEDSHHLFLMFDLAKSIAQKLCRWWSIQWVDVLNFEDWYSWFSSIRLPVKLKAILEGVFFTSWWHLWLFRNRLLFDTSPSRRSVLFEDIVSSSFLWSVNQCNFTFSWESW
nr:RNA-directed DNA polymerase, eukaryota [Tanacetum cinerariifolium]